MLKIRLKRVGRRHDPSFRIVALDSRQGPKSGRYIELLGTYNPRSDVRTVNAERVQHWIGQGAQVSDTVHNILVAEGVVEGKKVNALPRKSPRESETPDEAPAEKAPAAEEAETPATDTTEAAPEESAAADSAETESAEAEADTAPEAESTPEEEKQSA